MSRTSVITLVAVSLLFATFILAAWLYEKKRWPPALFFAAVSVPGFAITAVSGWLIDPATPVGPIAWRLARVAVGGLALVGLTTLVHKSRVRAGKRSVPVPDPFAEEKFSFARVFKAYLVILAVAFVVFALWIWWFVQSA